MRKLHHWTWEKSWTRMFYLREILITSLQKSQFFTHLLMIWDKLPYATIGRVCRNSPAKITDLFPKGFSIFIVSERQFETAWSISLEAMVTFSQMINLSVLSSSAAFELTDKFQVLSICKLIGILKLECAVVPLM